MVDYCSIPTISFEPMYLSLFAVRCSLQNDDPNNMIGGTNVYPGVHVPPATR